MPETMLPTLVLSVLTGVVFWVGNSVSKLNSNVAKIIERTEAHEKRLTNLEEKIFF